MNKRIVAELKKELEYIEMGAETSKHVYAMQKLLELLSDSDDKNLEPKLDEKAMLLRTPVTKQLRDDDAGNSRDIFDF